MRKRSQKDANIDDTSMNFRNLDRNAIYKEPKKRQSEPKDSHKFTNMYPKIGLRKRSRKNGEHLCLEGGVHGEFRLPFFVDFSSKRHSKIDPKTNVEKGRM